MEDRAAGGASAVGLPPRGAGRPGGSPVRRAGIAGETGVRGRGELRRRRLLHRPPPRRAAAPDRAGGGAPGGAVSRRDPPGDRGERPLPEEQGPRCLGTASDDGGPAVVELPAAERAGEDRIPSPGRIRLQVPPRGSRSRSGRRDHR